MTHISILQKALDLGIEYTTDFDDILACDIITIHTPKN
jgi:D-3-phosphoglycerate dehydrogenase / 2-oxoglutarate reductase